MKCSDSLAHTYFAQVSFCLPTQTRRANLFHLIKGSGVSFCSAKADQNTPVREAELWWRVRKSGPCFAARVFPYCKFSRQPAETPGSSWPGKSGT